MCPAGVGTGEARAEGRARRPQPVSQGASRCSDRRAGAFLPGRPGVPCVSLGAAWGYGAL